MKIESINYQQNFKKIQFKGLTEAIDVWNESKPTIKEALKEVGDKNIAILMHGNSFPSNIFEDIENFLNRKSDKPQLLYIWGHAYEIDFGCRLITLEKFEKICEMLANHNDIYYGTNSQVLFEK